MTDNTDTNTGADDPEWRELVDDDLLEESDSEHLGSGRSNPGGEAPETAVQDTADSTTRETSPRAEFTDNLSSTGGRARELGYRLAGIVTLPVAVFVMGGLGILTRFTPSGERFWSRMVELSFERFHRSAGGDAVGINHLPDGRVRPEAVKYLEASDEFEEGDVGGWKAKGREKKWREEAGGHGVHRLGRAPVVLLDEEADKRATMFEATVADAIERGDELFVYDTARIEPQIQSDITTVDPSDAGGDAAVADGGQPGTYVQDVQAWVQSLNVTDKGAISDWLVQIPEGGTQVSVPRVKDAYEEQGSAETLETVKTASYLAGKDGDYEDFLKKIVLYAFGFVLAVMFVVFALPEMLGGGGGGGGGGGSGIIPFATAMMGV